MTKFLVLVALFLVASCKTVISLPTFYSHSDLLNEVKELESLLRID
mgnify:CR=1 FL=1